jgi:hypothetical protein
LTAETTAAAARALQFPHGFAYAHGLAVEIRFLETVAVHDDEGAHTEPGQQQDGLPAQPPGARHGDPRLGMPHCSATERMSPFRMYRYGQMPIESASR